VVSGTLHLISSDCHLLKMFQFKAVCGGDCGWGCIWEVRQRIESLMCMCYQNGIKGSIQVSRWTPN